MEEFLLEVGAVGVVAQIKIADHDSLFESDTCSWKQRRSRRVAASFTVSPRLHIQRIFQLEDVPGDVVGSPRVFQLTYPPRQKINKIATKASLSLCF